MTYQVIARKFRPQTFEEIQGQEHIARTLKRAIETGRIHHAYLFTGGRGVGKTSTARILAKALNCVNGPTPSPCGACKSCEEIAQNISLDVREIDGASNTGVEDIRELREDVRYLPNHGKYRIYIIDEVHMLSNNAFNALLKTLEEPPEHIIFIFATTEPHKIIDTILSRCQRYDFRLLTQSKILKQLEKICAAEKITIDTHALHLLAQQAAGSMRDAETLLEQVIPFATGPIDAKIVTESLGLVDRKLIWESLSALVKRDSLTLMNGVSSLFEFGHDIVEFSKDLLAILRHLSIAIACQRDAKIAQSNAFQHLIDLPDHEVEMLLQLANDITLEESQRLYRLLSQSFFEISHASNQRYALEMCLLRMTQSPPLTDIRDLIDQLQTLKTGIPIPSQNMTQTSAQPVQTPASVPQSQGQDLWDQIVDHLKTTKLALASVLQEVRVMECTPEKVSLGVPKNSFLDQSVRDKNNLLILEKAMKEIIGQTPRIEIKALSDMKNLQSDSQKKAEMKKALSEEIKNDPTVQSIQSVFGANIEDVKTIER